MVITGGKDCKFKVWLLADLIKNDKSKMLHFCEFSDHTAEITVVKLLGTNRAISGSLDKQLKVYDISSKLCVKTI